MTTLARFVPFRSPLHDVAVLQNRLNSVFHEFTGNAEAPALSFSESLAAGSFVPPVDICEDAQHLVLQLEVPGIRQDDLNIHIENQTLTVKGQRNFQANQKEENFHRIERRYGSFTRTFTLPQTVDTEAVSAQYDAGVLTIAVPKKAEAKPRQIKVELSAPKAELKQVEGNTAA
jgi:HSP20 family protein